MIIRECSKTAVIAVKHSKIKRGKRSLSALISNKLLFSAADRIKDKTLIQNVHSQVAKLPDKKNGLSGTSHAAELYRLVKPQVERWPAAEQIDFYQKAGFIHCQCAAEGLAESAWIYAAMRHYFTAWRIPVEEKSVNKTGSQAADLMRLMFTAIARSFSSLMITVLQAQNPFANLPLETDDAWHKPPTPL